jgi:rare lipoprotein A
MFVGPIPCLLLLMGLTPTLEAPLVARSSVSKPPVKVWYGQASWYGPTFQGRATANGELYDMTAFTAAHMTLPFGAMVRLINPRNGKSTVVRINDRGPFVEGREIDVSYQAAEKLGLISRGVSKLRLELLEVPKRP